MIYKDGMFLSMKYRQCFDMSIIRTEIVTQNPLKMLDNIFLNKNFPSCICIVLQNKQNKREID